MTSIGRRCRGGNVYSRAILITQTLSGAQAPASHSPKGETEKHRSRQGRPLTGTAAKSRRRSWIEIQGSSRSTDPCSDAVRSPSGSVLVPYTDTSSARCTEKSIKVAIARGLHLFPFRTEKLNLATPMILRKWKSR